MQLVPEPSPADIPLDDQIVELERELLLRRKVYPHWIAQGKMTHATSQRQMLRLEAAIVTLKYLRGFKE